MSIAGTPTTDRSPGPLRALAVAATVLGVACALVVTVGPGLSDRVAYLDSGWPWHGFTLAFLLTGAVITIQRPRNRIGWLFVGLGVGGTLGGALAVVQLARSGPGSSWWITAGEAVATASLTLFLILVLLTFPTGRLLSPRWGWAAGLALLTTVLGTVAALLVGGWGGSPGDAAAPSPLLGVADGLAGLLSSMFYLLIPLTYLAGAVSLILRYRRSRGDERAQLRWLAPAGIAVLAVIPVVLFGPVADGERGNAGYTAYDLLTETVVVAAICLVPIGAGVAVLRYRLYDIDIVISRSLMVATLAAFVTGVYVAIVVGVGSLVGLGTEPDPLLSVTATAVVAVAFGPVRVRVRRLVDRLVYGQRATPYEVLAGFAHASRSGLVASGDDPLVRIAGLLAGGTGATATTVWLRSADGLRAAAGWPEPARGPAALPLDDGAEVRDPAADRTVPVFHDGELLGALSITKGRGDAVNPADEHLLSTLAGGLGLVLRNRGLTEELSDRVRALAASRQRVVADSDDVRRKLGRQLDTGAEAPLRACRGRLADLARRARQAGATRTGTLLEQIDADAQAAADSVRSFADGVYPPTLEADGLATALREAGRASPVPVTVDANGLGRYPREIEAAVYFCVLEACQNVAKYAGATTVAIRLADRGGELEFRVVDDGAGFEVDDVARGAGLTNMDDRMAALDGTVTIDSRPGHGTVVCGRLPLPAAV